MKAIVRHVLAAVFLLTFLFSSAMLLRCCVEERKQKDMYSELASIVDSFENNTGETVRQTPSSEISDVFESEISTTLSEESHMLPELEQLFSQNSDVVGWISIADTNINYPIMQSITSPNFYLTHGFDKKASDYGCPYVQENCDVQKPSDNLIIYGHHMKNGTMFADLEKYTSKEFWESHKTIIFYLLTSKQQYEILAVFRTTATANSAESFKYYEFTDAGSSNEFDDYVAMCKSLSLYDTGVSAIYGDKLITLSTCEYTAQNGRLVVIAKKLCEID